MATHEQTEPGLTPDVLRTRATISVEEAAEVLGLGRSGAYAAAKRGELPTLKIGRRLVVPTARLRAMLGEDDSPAQVAG